MKKESEYLRKSNTATLCKMIAETIKDPSTWNDASRTDISLALKINKDASNKIYNFHESITPQPDNKYYYKFPVKATKVIESEKGLLSLREYAVDCMLEVRYLLRLDSEQSIIFTFLIDGNLSDLDVDNIIDTSVKYLEDKADEILKDIVK